MADISRIRTFPYPRMRLRMARKYDCMRNGVRSQSNRNFHTVTIVAVCGWLAITSGCQLAQPATLTRSLTSPQTPTANVRANQTVPGARATIRGQSPTTYSGQAFGVGDSGSVPMQPTVVQAPNYATPNFYAPQNTPAPLAPNPYADQLPGGSFMPGPVAPNGGVPAPVGPFGANPYPIPNAALNGTNGQGNFDGVIAPGATGGVTGLGSTESTLAPGVYPPEIDPSLGISAPGAGRYEPVIRDAPIDIYAAEARTGRIILGGSVNSDLGLSGQLIVEERNFDFRALPTNWNDFFSGRAFRGGGQNFRAELMPGTRVQRYTVNWTQPNLFEYMPISLSVGGFLFTRQYRDWTEQRLGGRIGVGYAITRDLTIGSEVRLEDVKVFDPRLVGIPELDRVQGSNDLYSARVRLAHDTRDNPYMATEGHLLELMYDQVFGEYDYPRGMVNYSRYFLVRERADQGGRHTLASTWRFGVTGEDTPLFENFFAGGYSTMRGFSFRGASPKTGDVQVGGRAMFLGSLEYVFPLTADDMLRGIAFVDYGTIEKDLEITGENFRVAPGLGLRIAVPALGPAPLAFDFAVPIARAETDDVQIFSFFMGFTR